MRRREFVTLLGAAAWPPAASAQTKPVVGFLSSRTAADSAHLVSAFRQGVAASGSIEAKDAEIVFRWADGPPWMASPHPERFTGAIFISAGVASEF
jgi:putative ABC transport system substrate-binding protein